MVGAFCFHELNGERQKKISGWLRKTVAHVFIVKSHTVNLEVTLGFLLATYFWLSQKTKYEIYFCPPGCCHYLLLIFFLFIKSFSQAPSGLFISECIESSSSNKALEFYNDTGSAIDLTAGNYIIQMYFNGSTAAGTTITVRWD